MGALPELCVFDLDACLWDKEMFQMDAVPEVGDSVRGELNGRGEGVRGVRSGRATIALHAGALVALQEHADGLYPGMRVALASSAVSRCVERGGAALGGATACRARPPWARGVGPHCSTRSGRPRRPQWQPVVRAIAGAAVTAHSHCATQRRS